MCVGGHLLAITVCQSNKGKVKHFDFNLSAVYHFARVCAHLHTATFCCSTSRHRSHDVRRVGRAKGWEEREAVECVCDRGKDSWVDKLAPTAGWIIVRVSPCLSDGSFLASPCCVSLQPREPSWYNYTLPWIRPHTRPHRRSNQECTDLQLATVGEKKPPHVPPLDQPAAAPPPPGKSCDRWSNHRLLRHMCRDHGERRAGCCGKPIAALHKWGISKIKCWHAGDGERERERGVTNTESWAKMAGKCIKMWPARISYYVFIVFSINPFRFCSIKNDNFLKPTLIFKLFYLKSHGVVFSKHLPNPGRDDSFPCGLQLWCVHCHHVLSERGCETARRYKPLKSQTATTARWKSIRLTLPEHSRTRWSVKSLVRVSLSHVHRLPPSSSGVSSDVSSEVVATGDAWNNTFL